MDKFTHCPLCYEELLVVETTPCISCGSSKTSLKILKQDIEENFSHDSINYSIYRAFEKFEVMLCNICTLDFTSVASEFFRFKKEKTINPSDFQFLKIIKNPAIGKDKFCPSCNMRLAYLLFIEKTREINPR